MTGVEEALPIISSVVGIAGGLSQGAKNTPQGPSGLMNLLGGGGGRAGGSATALTSTPQAPIRTNPPVSPAALLQLISQLRGMGIG